MRVARKLTDLQVANLDPDSRKNYESWLKNGPPLMPLNYNPGWGNKSIHFVYMCPLRMAYAICVIDAAGRYYAAPGWTNGGSHEMTDNSGAGIYDIEEADSTSTLYEVGGDMLARGEHFACTSLPGTDRHSAPDCDWLPLGNHEDVHAQRGHEITEKMYDQWTKTADFLFGQTGAHLTTIRAAKARRKKVVRKKIRDRRKKANVDLELS